MRARGEARKGAPVALDRISPLLICAVIKAEDRAFFRHDGFDWSQLRRAAGKFFTEPGRSMGGSTITQQLARNLFLDPSRSALRKIREALLAIELERVLTKRRILEIYLNVIEWGEDLWGIRAAGEKYFGKSPDQLDAFESAFLVGLIAAPRRTLEGRELERARRVQLRVLHQLYFSGLIEREEWAAASARIAEVAAAIQAGVAVEVALSRSAGSRFDAAPLPLERTLEQECGLERELRETALNRAKRR
jgi:membrane peptidoglycan carboxypeptidase